MGGVYLHACFSSSFAAVFGRCILKSAPQDEHTCLLFCEAFSQRPTAIARDFLLLLQLSSEKAFAAQFSLGRARRPQAGGGAPLADRVAVHQSNFSFCVLSRRPLRIKQEVVAPSCNHSMMFSLASSAPLNGAKCLPCRPCAPIRKVGGPATLLPLAHPRPCAKNSSPPSATGRTACTLGGAPRSVILLLPASCNSFACFVRALFLHPSPGLMHVKGGSRRNNPVVWRGVLHLWCTKGCLGHCGADSGHTPIPASLGCAATCSWHVLVPSRWRRT